MPFIQHHTAPPVQAVVQPAAVQQQVSDEALLGEVQSDVLREYPDALAPVGTSAETAVSTSQTKTAAQTKTAKKEHKKK
jgi:hypothetical protein